MSEPIPNYPGKWIDAGQTDRIDQTLNNLMAAQPARLVWAGVKSEGRPVHVLTQGGQRHEIAHAPIGTFGERLHALTGAEPARGQGTSLNPAEVYARRRATAQASQDEPEQTGGESSATVKTDDPLDADSIYAMRRAQTTAPGHD